MTTMTTRRNRVKPARNFGEGILPSYPTYQAPASLADMEWWDRESNLERYAADYDFWAAVSEAEQRIELGSLL